MAFNLEVAQLQTLLHQQKARWIAEISPLSHLPIEQKRLRLGASPPANTPSLQERERLVKTTFKSLGAAAAAPGFAPASFDWRDFHGQNYVTPIRDQSSCGSCVAFGSIAAVEATLRVIEHNPSYPIDLSEAQLFYCLARSQGRTCENGWWPNNAMDCLANPGVADEACYPYTPGDQNCTGLCPDWQHRALRITGWHSFSNPADMKAWISTHGPIATCFSVYEDFYSYGSGVYHHVTGDFVGGHCVCVVGYDDSAQCWICKNSWGAGWGDHGYFRINYGDSGIDHEMFAVEGVAAIKRTLTDTAIGAPALANVNDTVLAIAWTGTDSSHHLNVMGSRDEDFSFGNKVILPETSFDGPGFCFGNGRAYLAWVGTDSEHHLNVVSSPDCQHFSNKVTMADTSRFGPALAFGNGKVFIAWVGTDSGWSLNVMSSTDGVTWKDKVTLHESSDSAPSLAFANGRLYLLWQGTDHNSSINILESTDGVHFTNKVTLQDSSDFHPTLGALPAELVLAWTGRDSSHHLNTMRSTTGSHGFGSKLVYDDTSIAAPALLMFRGKMYIAWTGTDSSHRLNVMKLPFV